MSGKTIPFNERVVDQTTPCLTAELVIGTVIKLFEKRRPNPRDMHTLYVQKCDEVGWPSVSEPTYRL